MKPINYRALFADNIRLSFKTAARVLAEYPASVLAFARFADKLRQAETRRAEHSKNGIEPPPLIIVSATESCNLSCKGCYASARQRRSEGTLSGSRILEIMDEASELGVSIVMLAGGEPLLSSEWLSAMSKHYEMAGIVFTNGTLLDESFAKLFAEHRHMIPVISIEGAETQTDARRGGGAHEKVIKAMSVLRSRAVPFGVSITVSSENIETVLSDDFIAEYIQKGCRLFVFVEYVPVEIRTEALALSMENKNRLSNFAGESASKHSALFIAFPGGEERFGGCLAAGRGFIHVSASGNVEPCPFAPFSDTNLKNTSLKCALNSVLLSKVRENHSLLSEGNGGCALWRNREQIIRLLGESS